MARDRKQYDDDDGRTIADMSDLGRPPMFIPRIPGERRAQAPEPEEPRESRPWEQTGLSPEERRWYMLGALKAALLIALAFIVGLGVTIALLLVFWS